MCRTSIVEFYHKCWVFNTLFQLSLLHFSSHYSISILNISLHVSNHFCFSSPLYFSCMRRLLYLPLCLIVDLGHAFEQHDNGNSAPHLFEHVSSDQARRRFELALNVTLARHSRPSSTLVQTRKWLTKINTDFSSTWLTKLSNDLSKGVTKDF